MLDYCRAEADPLEIFFFKLSHRQFQKFRHKFNLRLRNPDIPLPRPGAAFAALGTSKMQSCNIPGIFFHKLDTIIDYLKVNHELTQRGRAATKIF